MDRLLLVESFPVIVKGMEHLLTFGRGMEIEMDSVLTFEAMDEIMAKERYDICIIGIRLDDNQLFFLNVFLRENPKLKVILFVDACLLLPYDKLFYAGLSGILDKHDGIEEILLALETVKKGEKFICQRLLKNLVSARNLVNHVPFPSLSNRETTIATCFPKVKKTLISAKYLA